MKSASPGCGACQAGRSTSVSSSNAGPRRPPSATRSAWSPANSAVGWPPRRPPSERGPNSSALTEKFVEREQEFREFRHREQTAMAELEALRGTVSELKQEARHARDREGAARSLLERVEAERDDAIGRATTAAAQRDALLADRADLPDGSQGAAHIARLRQLADVARTLVDGLTAMVSTGPSPRQPVDVPRTAAKDPRKTAEYLLKAPGMVVFVDGYNVAKLGWPDLSLEQQRANVARLRRRAGATIRHRVRRGARRRRRRRRPRRPASTCPCALLAGRGHGRRHHSRRGRPPRHTASGGCRHQRSRGAARRDRRRRQRADQRLPRRPRTALTCDPCRPIPTSVHRWQPSTVSVVTTIRDDDTVGEILGGLRHAGPTAAGHRRRSQSRRVRAVRLAADRRRLGGVGCVVPAHRRRASRRWSPASSPSVDWPSGFSRSRSCRRPDARGSTRSTGRESWSSASCGWPLR